MQPTLSTQFHCIIIDIITILQMIDKFKLSTVILVHMKIKQENKGQFENLEKEAQVYKH